MKKTVGISLVSLHKELSTKLLEAFTNMAINWFKRYNIYPTYWAVHGKGFSTKYTKFTDNKLSNLIEKKGYLDKDGNVISNLSFVVNPPESDMPTFDQFCKISISYSSHRKELKVYTIINLNKVLIQENEIGSLIKEINHLFEVDFGFIYTDESYDHVSAVLVEYNDRKFTDGENKKEEIWYNYTREEKLQNLRNIYPVNILRKKYYEEQIRMLLNGDRKIFQTFIDEKTIKGFLNTHIYKNNLIEVDIGDGSLACIVDKNDGLKFF